MMVSNMHVHRPEWLLTPMFRICQGEEDAASLIFLIVSLSFLNQMMLSK